MLVVEHLSAHYGGLAALQDVSLRIAAGEIVAVLGANAAGKSTVMNAISGVVKPSAGQIFFKGASLAGVAPHLRPELGIIQVPEGRRLFKSMTVLENLEIGSFLARARLDRARNLERVFSLFPRLKERRRQVAGLMSGGEQQMCAIGRGLMANPELLMLDEPTLGLAPGLVVELFRRIEDVNKSGVTVLLVEQNVSGTLQLANRSYALENGRVVLQEEADRTIDDAQMKKIYFGL